MFFFLFIPIYLFRHVSLFSNSFIFVQSFSLEVERDDDDDGSMGALVFSPVINVWMPFRSCLWSIHVGCPIF